MPFDRNSDLPKNVRAVLPAPAQTKWRRAFNSKFDSGATDSKSAAAAWSALRADGWRPPPADAPDGAKWRKVGKGEYTGTGRRRRKKKKRTGKSATGLISEQKTVTTPAMSKSFFTTEKITKVDDDLGIVFGWGIICKEGGEDYYDLQDDHIPESAMLKASTEFMYDVRVAGEMHETDQNGDAIHKGVIVHSFPLTEDIAKAFDLTCEKTGWMIGMKPDADMLAKFRDGSLTGFSIGGFRGEDEIVEDDD